MAFTLVKEPIYQQLNNHLKLLISSGECAVGSQFLTERQICERFGVSRATANKALSNLVDGEVRGVALRRAGEVDRGMREVDARLGPPHRFGRLERGVRHQKRPGIG